MKLKPYKDFFHNLSAWAFGTAVCQFVVFFLTFLLLCFAYTVLKVPDDSNPKEEIFVSKFEKYLILTSALLLLFPYLFSFILTFALLHKHQRFLDVWIKASVGFSPVFSLGLFSAGIYLSVEGSYIGYITIVISLLFGAFMVHSILLIYYINEDYYKKNSEDKAEPNDQNSEEGAGNNDESL